MNKPNIARGIVIVVLMMGLSGCLSNEARRLPGESRQLGDNTLNWREHWRKTQIRIEGFSWERSYLLSVSGKVVCLQDDSVGQTYQLQVFDATNGNRQWLSRGKPRAGLGELAADAKRVYVIASFKIHAYDLNDGRPLWESQEMPSHRSYYLYSDGKKLQARDLTKEIAYYFDVSTGTLLDSISLSAGEGFTLLARFPQFDLRTSSRAVQAVDRVTQRPLWTTDMENIGPVKRLPALFDNVLLVGVGEQVFAIDAPTGQVKWRNQDTPFASNFVVTDDGYLYALDYKARLVRFDVKTGQEKEHLQFTPAQANVSKNRYWVATDGQTVFVSFEDSQELIALGP